MRQAKDFQLRLKILVYKVEDKFVPEIKVWKIENKDARQNLGVNEIPERKYRIRNDECQPYRMRRESNNEKKNLRRVI